MGAVGRFFGHLKTIAGHRRQVRRLCRKCGIGFQGLFHDLSKYSPAEFIPGVKYYSGKRSPNEGERAEKGYSSAWLHHKGRNRHHFEYWSDYNMAKRRVEPVEMPLNYAAEMFCDRVAASIIYQGENYTCGYPLQYFLRGKAHRYISEKTSDKVEGWLRLLSVTDEDTACSVIRKEVEAYREENKKKRKRGPA